MDILRNERSQAPSQQTQSQQPQQPTQAPARRDEKPFTTLGKDTEFEGTLKFKEGLRIEGKFNGDISSEGHLIIGETGDVKAEIAVGSIIVEGKINGNIVASDLVDLRTSAELRGDITASKLKIDEGVIFIGKSDVQPNNKGKDVKAQSQPQQPQKQEEKKQDNKPEQKQDQKPDQKQENK